jgi:fructose-1,6-bisphosphatase/inositol monophosphatase family enzyme
MKNLYIILSSEYQKDIDTSSVSEWGAFLLKLGFDLTMKVRENRFSQRGMKVKIKEDNSPATDFEFSLEEFAKEKLIITSNSATFIGEEHGELEDSTDYSLIMDPIDGTRSFLDFSDTYSISLAIIKKNQCIVSLISSPSTGDIFYREGSDTSVLISFPFGGGESSVHQLPLKKKNNQSIILNIHPARKAEDLIKRAYRSWQANQIQLVKSVSGSPSLNIAKVALGSECYLNMWTEKAIAPYDLIAGIHILQGAGGATMDVEMNEINAMDHTGMFIAGIDQVKLKKIIESI